MLLWVISIMATTYASHTLTHTCPHLCIISVTSSLLFTANLHLPLNFLALAAHCSGTVMVHIHLRSPPSHFFFFLSVYWKVFISHYVRPQIALFLFVLHMGNFTVTNSCLNWLSTCSYSLRLGYVTNYSSWMRIPKGACICHQRITERVCGCVYMSLFT